MEHLCGKQVKSDGTDKSCLTGHIGAGNKDRFATECNVIRDTTFYKRDVYKRQVPVIRSKTSLLPTMGPLLLK